GGRVVELVERGNREVEGAARGGAGRGADRVVGGGGRADADGVAGAGDAAGHRVRGGERLAAGRPQGGAEGARPVREGAVVGQGGLAVAAFDFPRLFRSGGRVVELVERGDREVEGAAGGGAGRGADGVVGGVGGADRDGVARPGDAAGHRVR